MISTSSHKDWQSDFYLTYAISGNRGIDAGYEGKCYPSLAPRYAFWKIWHDNIGKASEEENNKYYVKEYWQQVLSHLDPEQVLRDIDCSILLCYEPNTEFCHRHIVAAWLEILLDIDVPEVKLNNGVIEKTYRPAYIKTYLDEAMRENRNMRGFNSLRALYLFEKGEKLEAMACKLEEKTDKCYDNYRQAACFLRCEADEEEAVYNEKNKTSYLVKQKRKTYIKREK